MNQKEFLEYLSKHLPSTFEKVTIEHLKQWEDLGVLRPHPEYHQDDVHKVIGIIKLEQSLKKQDPVPGNGQEKPVLPSQTSGAIYQILSFLQEPIREVDLKEISVAKMALTKTGLISALGFVYINFSPFTGETLDSLLKKTDYRLSFEKAVASKTLFIVQEATQFVEGKPEKEMFTAINPVLFIQGIKPMTIYSTLIFSGQGRLVGPGQYIPLPHPLYEEFLKINMKSLDDILKFMSDHLMVGNLGIPPDKDTIEFVKTTQEKMMNILKKAAKGSIGVADLSPLSPFHEDDAIEASRLGQMSGMDIFNPEGNPVSLGEIKIAPAYKWRDHEWVPYDQNKIHISRYYCWLDFMWAELKNDIISGAQTPVCHRCGTLLPQPKTGRRKLYCGPENLDCYHARKARHTRKSRESHM